MVGRGGRWLSWLLVGGLIACGSDMAGPGGNEASAMSHLGELLPGPGGLRFADVWGYADPATGKEYALLGVLGQPLLFVIDVSDPEAPATAAVVQVPSFDIKVWGHYAYTVTGSGDQGTSDGRIVDLSDPTNPQVVGAFPSSHNLVIDDRGFMYLEYPGLRILDLNGDPLHPQPVLLLDPSDGHDATVVGNRLYDFHGVNANIYDVTQPASPSFLGRIEDPEVTYYHSGWPTEDGRFLFLHDELSHRPAADVTIWDISQPDDPIRVGSISDDDATVHNVEIIGTLAYVSYYSGGFRIYDVSAPATPREVYHYRTSLQTGEGFVGAFGVYAFTPSGRVFVSDMMTGLHVFGR